MLCSKCGAKNQNSTVRNPNVTADYKSCSYTASSQNWFHVSIATLAIYVLMGIFMSDATAEPVLNARIKNIKSSLRQLQSKIKKADDGERHIVGNMIPSEHAKEFECFALGIKFGFHREVSHLDLQKSNNYKENINHKDIDSLNIIEATMSRFLDELISAKIDKSSMTAFRWNTNCLGQLGISSDLGIAENSKPFYSITKDGTRLTIHGRINRGYAKRLKEVLNRHIKVNTIEIGSGGGYVDEAITAGRLIRSKKITTQLTAYCHSACPLVFMGGIDRIIMRPYYGLGFHQVSIDGQAIPSNDIAYREIATYVNQMGVDYKYVLRQMLSAPPSKMSIWNIEMNNKINDDACKANVVTFVQGVCTES